MHRLSDKLIRMASYAFDRYLSFDELSEQLQELARQFPGWCTLEVIGHSHQGRPIWALTITNPNTAPAAHKPGYYIDGQIHAEEHTASIAALHAAWYLLHHKDSDPLVSRLLAEQVFYVLPRINPDGAEYSLQPPYYRWCGNGRHQAGSPDERLQGLYQSDVNGDGFIARMRQIDPSGEWKTSPLDPRLLVQREPGESGGVYYRLYPEGLVPDYDGVEVTIEPTRDGNLNRQFPGGWEPASRQYGAGLYPGCEPEAKAVIDFILARPNLCGVNTYHTHGALHLRPSGMLPDLEMNQADLHLLQTLGERGTAITGYPCVSVFEEFTPDKSKVRRGCLDDWTFEELGIPSFTTELWDVETAAGIRKQQHYGNPRSPQDDVKLLHFVQQHWGSQGWRDWTPFDHPQLGPVEIGGWVDIWVWRNPPPAFLPQLCWQNTQFCLAHAAASPKLELSLLEQQNVGTTPQGFPLVKVRVSVSNQGFLPTHLSQTALQKQTVGPVQAQLHLQGAQVAQGQAVRDLGHLAGRQDRQEEWSPWGKPWQRSAVSLEWIICIEGPNATGWLEVGNNKTGLQRLKLWF